MTRNTTAEYVLSEIERIQQEWWEGSVPMNVALSEIRSVISQYRQHSSQTAKLCLFHQRPLGPPPATNCEECRNAIDRRLSASDRLNVPIIPAARLTDPKS